MLLALNKSQAKLFTFFAEQALHLALLLPAALGTLAFRHISLTGLTLIGHVEFTL